MTLFLGGEYFTAGEATFLIGELFLGFLLVTLA